jgi:hypothetical protein
VTSYVEALVEVDTSRCFDTGIGSCLNCMVEVAGGCTVGVVGILLVAVVALAFSDFYVAARGRGLRAR